VENHFNLTLEEEKPSMIMHADANYSLSKPSLGNEMLFAVQRTRNHTFLDGKVPVLLSPSHTPGHWVRTKVRGVTISSVAAVAA
jgi:hypothetical protein